MAHKKYTAKQGDSISSIAFDHGFFPDTIWDDAKNSKLKKEREDPNVLLPGDVVYIPDKEEKEESCAGKNRHRFRRKGVPEKLVIQFKIGDKPMANEAYVLIVDGERSEGQTDWDGKVEIAIPPHAKRGKISFKEEGDEFELELGDLDPITETSGVQARLQNLGFYDGPVDGKPTDKLDQAISNYQKAKNFKPTGKVDEKTRKQLEQDYKSQG